MLLTEVFGKLGLRQPGAAAIDVPALLDAVADPGARTAEVRAALGAALCGVLAALAVRARFGGSPAPCALPVRPAMVTEEPALSGARRRALDDLRTAIVALARTP